jgi:hypothetical protein
MLRKVAATRYIEPLRSGGSVPGVVEADDLGTYVVKFTGSAQGRKALVAEVIVGELARALGLRFPELVLVHFEPAIWTTSRARGTSPRRSPERSAWTRWRRAGSSGSTR